MTASIIGLAAGLFQTTRPGTSTLAICRHGVVLLPCPEKAKATALPQHLNPLPYPVGQLVNAASTFVSTPVILVNDFRPSHPTRAFDPARSAEPPPAVVPVLSSTLLPGFMGRNFLTTTASSATSPPPMPWLSPWSQAPLRRVWGQASPVTAPAPC